MLLFLLIAILQTQVDSLCNLSYKMENKGEFTEAIRLNEEALLLTPKDSLVWMGDICSNLTTEYFYTGNLVKAAQYGMRTLQIDEQTGDEEALSYSLNNLAAIYMQLGQTERAVNMARRAVELEEQRGEEHEGMLARRLGILCEALTKAGRYEEAIPQAMHAIAIDQKQKNEHALGVHLSQLGNVYNQLGDKTKAISILEEALPLLRKCENIKSLAISLVPYAQSLRKDKRYEETEQALVECIDLARQTSQRQTLLSAYHEQAELYDELRNERDDSKLYGKLSHEALEQYIRLKDSLYTERLQREVADLQVRYETEKKEHELQQSIGTLRRLRMIVASTAALALVLAVLLFYIIRYARSQKRVAIEKNRTVSILSHDLKSPALAQQRVLRQLANGNMDQSPETMKALAKAQDAQVDLILNMLDYARIGSGNMKVDPIAFDLKMVAEEVIVLLQQQANEKQVALRIENKVETTITADRNMVEIIMRNLVSNAIKFSKTEGEVVVRIQTHGFEIEDKGIGFGAPSAEKGTGLGLTICKRLAHMNNADIEIHSDRQRGTTVQVFFHTKKRH